MKHAWFTHGTSLGAHAMLIDVGPAHATCRQTRPSNPVRLVTTTSFGQDTDAVRLLS